MFRPVAAILLALALAIACGQQQADKDLQLREKAEQGILEAQYTLGLMYYEGEGVPQDYAEALKWFRLAAEQGDPRGRLGLGLMYFKGEGVPQDHAEAFKWLRLAAEQGDPSAQSSLGLMYHEGQSVPQDFVRAHKWVNLAASRSTGEKREKRVEARDLVADKMTPEQVAEAQRLAHEWKPKTLPEEDVSYREKLKALREAMRRKRRELEGK